MDADRAVVATGCAALDQVLEGGFPRNRSVLVTGGPGTGKSTLSMQFLQEGVRQGEECLFVSTEQTPAELRDSFAPYDFDLDHDDLTITSIHARPGYTLDAEEEQLTIETLEGDQLIGEGYSAPFSGKYVTQLLGRYAPADRVVVDSVSGLRVMADDYDVFRRAVLDLIRLVSDEFEATALLVAEGNHDDGGQLSVVDPLQYNVHGVVRLWRERKGSEYRRFINVMKMRGINHDTRSYEVTFGDGGVEVIPFRRALPPGAVDQKRLTTGIGAFDALLSGGFPRGDSVVLEHDGKANIDTLLFTAASSAFTRDMDLVLLPRVNTSPRRVDTLVANTVVNFDDVQELLESNRLFVLDAFGAWENYENVYDLRADDTEMEDQLRAIRETSAGDGLLLALNTEAKVHVLNERKVRRIRYWLQSRFLGPDDILLDVHNPNVMTSRMAEFYIDAASWVISTWLDENGLQYIRLEKGITGDVGGLRLMEYVDEYPPIRMK
jgi:KaiC/GvpD/RAD55 family RecA-like ATPase